jgi:DNA-binding transcriptional LysR family regulator
VALVCLPAPTAGLKVLPIGEEGVVVAMPDGHPGAGQAALPIEQLDDAAPILLTRDANPPFYDSVLGAARMASITIRPTHVRTVEQALLAAASGRSVALLPSSVAERHVLSGVRFMPLAEPSPSTTVALVTAGSIEHLQAARFVRLVTAIARSRRSAPGSPRLSRVDAA